MISDNRSFCAIMEMTRKTQSLNQSMFRQALLTQPQTNRRTFDPKEQQNDCNISNILTYNRKVTRARPSKRKPKRESAVSQIPYSIGSEKVLGDIQQFKTQNENTKQISWNLTSILVTLNINRKYLIGLFGAFVLSRYISIAYTIYFAAIINLQYLQVFSILMISNLMYWMCIIKISLKIPETHSEIYIKCVFNSLEEDDVAGDYFKRISKTKLVQSILKSVVPAEYSFVFIGALSTERRKVTYLMINFIYCSSEAVIYFPGFLIYNIFQFENISDLTQNTMYIVVMSLMLLSWSCFMLFACYLVYKGKQLDNVPTH